MSMPSVSPVRSQSPDPTSGTAPTTGQETPGPTVLAIDPGNAESAYVVLDHRTRRPVAHGKVLNAELLDYIAHHPVHAHVAIEMVASYGMPVGADVFETCVWIGRFQEQIETLAWAAGAPLDVELVKRHQVKLHHCHSAKAKDSNITQALVDRFASGVRNHGKGTKAQPGWFYGFKADVWQAYALGVYIADTTHVLPPSASVSVSNRISLPVPETDTDQAPGAAAEGEAAQRRDTTTSEGALW